MDFECQDEGYLAKILVPANTKDVKVGQPLAILVDDKADVEKFRDYVVGTPPAAPKVAEAPKKTEAPKAAPAPASAPAAKAAPAAAPVSRTPGGGLFRTRPE